MRSRWPKSVPSRVRCIEKGQTLPQRSSISLSRFGTWIQLLRQENFTPKPSLKLPMWVIPSINHMSPNEPILVMRKLNGENTPIRFEFDGTPRPRYSSTELTPVGLGLRSLEREYLDPTTEYHNSQRHLSNIIAPSIQHSIDDPILGDQISETQLNTEQPSAVMHLNSYQEHSHCGNPYGETQNGDFFGALGLSSGNANLFALQNISEEDEQRHRLVKSTSCEEVSSPTLPPLSKTATSLDYARQSATVGIPARTQAPDHQRPTDEDEALWRSFVFGGDDPNQDWIIEEEDETNRQKHLTANVDAQTQTSMEAEVATSPIKQNAHLLEEFSNSSSPAAKTTGASLIAAASSTSQANSDEMLDTCRQQNSFSPYLQLSTPQQDRRLPKPHLRPLAPSSSIAGQVSTSPMPTTMPSTTSTPNGVSSSLIVQPATTTATSLPPAQPSSDELAWSPARISESIAKPTVLFKKPARYAGQRSSGPIETIRLGGARRLKPMNARKSKESARALARDGTE